jgi:PilZ domain
MLNDRRIAVRHVVNRPAKLLESPAARECTIRDISATGVKLVVPGGMASDQFTLFDGEAIEHRCSVIWRLGELVGARFVK